MLAYMQRVGRALMVPAATLPAAAILKGIGYWLVPSIENNFSVFAAFLIISGSAILDNMPLLFAVGVAYGMSKDKSGAAALTGLIGFFILSHLLTPTSVALLRQVALTTVPLAFSHVENQFLGILVGLISAAIYNRFYSVELPNALAFFNGQRLVPILTALAMLLVAVGLIFVWPLIFSGLSYVGQQVQGTGAIGAGFYAFFNRLLIPMGLHHTLNSAFWFDVIGINDIPNFLSGQNAIDSGQGIVGITGRYQAGFFPIMMFGLPGAALAIYHCADKIHRQRVGAIMLAATLSSFFTGITEPLEFSFMFAAPLLYVLHAFLSGISVYIAATMQWMAGFGFSAGLLDLMLSIANPLAQKWYMLIFQGIIFFFIYYFSFRIFITVFNLKTLGRAGNDSITVLPTRVNSLVNEQVLAQEFIHAVGGKDNLLQIDACITRLRLVVKNMQDVDEQLAKQYGASAVVKLNQHDIQIIIGTRADKIANAMKNIVQQ